MDFNTDHQTITKINIKSIIFKSILLEIGLFLERTFVLLPTILFSFCGVGGKRADISSNGKRLPPPIDICNTRGIISASSALEGWGGGWREGLGIWASSILTHSVQHSASAVSHHRKFIIGLNKNFWGDSK